MTMAMDLHPQLDDRTLPNLLAMLELASRSVSDNLVVRQAWVHAKLKESNVDLQALSAPVRNA